MCVRMQAAAGGAVHPTQLEALQGSQRFPAVPPQGGAPAVCLAQQARPPRASQEAHLPAGSWQAAAGLLTCALALLAHPSCHLCFLTSGW